MNVIPEDKVKRFFHMYHWLLLYVNNNHKFLDGLHDPDDLFKLSPENLGKIKDKLYASPDQIDSFVRDNPANFTPDDLKIISSWKNFVRGRFYIVRYLKNHAVFLEEKPSAKAYGVLGLVTPIDEMMGSTLPRIVEAVLLPYNGNIIYDGTFTSYNVFLGPGIRKNINDIFNQAKSGFGIITSLPFDSEKSRPTDSEKLRGFLKSQYSRDVHYQEIQEMLEKNPDLMAVYSEEMGRVYARTYRKRLKEIGIKEGWFGLMDGIIITGGRTRNDAEKSVKSLVPAEKMKLVHFFQLKAE